MSYNVVAQRLTKFKKRNLDAKQAKIFGSPDILAGAPEPSGLRRTGADALRARTSGGTSPRRSGSQLLRPRRRFPEPFPADRQDCPGVKGVRTHEARAYLLSFQRTSRSTGPRARPYLIPKADRCHVPLPRHRRVVRAERPGPPRAPGSTQAALRPPPAGGLQATIVGGSATRGTWRLADSDSGWPTRRAASRARAVA